MDECQNITKLFSGGKEHQSLIELVAELNNEFVCDPEIESYEESNSLYHKFYSPVLMSELKLAAYELKFINNYIKNISIYIRQLKIAQIDNNHDEKQCNKFRAWLNKITVKHVTITMGLLDYYHELAKAQHGASQVNLLPWEFYDRVSQLPARLELMSKSVTDKVWKT